MPMPADGITLRPPSAADGLHVFRLIQQCPPLEGNSLYCNLLQCSHFSGTSAVAEADNNRILGFASGYVLPERGSCLFIWQVAVHEQVRGWGLGCAMIASILQRGQCRAVTEIEASVTSGNTASRRMWERFTGRLGVGLKEAVLFDRNRHFGGDHATELLLRIDVSGMERDAFDDLISAHQVHA